MTPHCIFMWDERVHVNSVSCFFLWLVKWRFLVPHRCVMRCNQLTSNNAKSCFESAGNGLAACGTNLLSCPASYRTLTHPALQNSLKTPSSLITKVKKNWQDFLLSEGGGGNVICTVFSVLLPHLPWKHHGFFESGMDVVVEPRCREGKGAGPWAPRGACRWIP